MVFELSPISFVLDKRDEDRGGEVKAEWRTVSCSILRACEIQ